MSSPLAPYRIGVIGAGYWAKNMMRSIVESPDSELVVVADLDELALGVVKRRYPGTKTTSDTRELLSDDSLDAIYIATPPSTHTEFAEAALLSGKHVLVEKPMTTSLDDAVLLAETARQEARVLMVGHTFLYSPPVVKVKELLDSEVLGRTYYLDSQRVNLGKYQHSGVLWDLAPHDLSIMLYWLDELPMFVQASGRSFLHTGANDAAFLTLHFPSEVLVQLQLSWLAPARLRRSTLALEHGMIVYDDGAGAEAVKVFQSAVERGTAQNESVNYRVGDTTIPHLETYEPLRTEWDHFVHCIRFGKVPKSSAQTGVWTVAIIEAAERALKTGQREEIEYPHWSLKMERTQLEVLTGA